MNYYEFSLNTPFSYNWCGKFQAPNPEWMHLTRDLLDFELFVVTDGILYIGDHNHEYAINKGDFFLMAPTPYQHGYKSSDCSFYWMHFSPTSPSYDINENSSDYYNICTEHFKTYNLLSNDTMPSLIHENSVIIPVSGTLTTIDRIIVLMKQLQDCDKRYHNYLLNNFITSTILTELSCQFAQYEKGSHSNEKSQLYNDIADYVSWHICENIKVSEIADYFGYNEKYLSTFFHRMSGSPLKQFILQAKMDHAKAELTDTNRTVSQIAYNIGFSDPHNFTNAFKKITGLTPTEYRVSYAKRSLFYK